jgi:uncharacterized membrane protein YbhN (UPF0104 family)
MDLGVLMALTFGAMLLPIVRWWWLLRVQGLHEPMWRVLVLSWVSSFFGLLLPGGASSDMAKTYLIVRRCPRARARAFSTVLADRFLGLYSILFLACLAVAWLLFFRGETARGIQVMATGILAIFLGMTGMAGCLVFVPTRRVFLRVVPRKWRAAWKESFELYCHGRQHLAGCFLISTASSAMTFMSFTVAGRMMGEFVSWSASFIAGPLVILANCLPITPGGIGTAEAFSSELFTEFGSSHGAEIMILVRIANALLILPGVVGLCGHLSRREDDAFARTATPPAKSEPTVSCESAP